MFFLVDVVFVADVACSLLWEEDIIGSMPGSHLVVLPSGETASRTFITKAILSGKRYNFIFLKNQKIQFAIPNWTG